ncbi:MAG: conjugal transfer protein [Acidobacteria bacterium]|nr:MAG: conjugal transfer protein [Acidobacteriota bacterium]
MKRTIVVVLLGLFAVVSADAQNREARTIKYSAKDIVLIKARLRYTTLIVLPRNEKILDFVTGDKDFWVVEGTQNFCYIKPAKQGGSTDVTLITAAGNVYSFLVKEVDEGDEPDLKVFIEPKDQSILQAMNAPPKFVLASEVEALRSQAALATSQAEKDKDAFQAEYPIKSLRFDYAFEKEKKPFMVSAIYHDDKFTYIRSSAEEKPTLYEVKDGSPNLINFDLKDGVYIVPKVLDSGYLVIGKHRLDFKKQG